LVLLGHVLNAGSRSVGGKQLQKKQNSLRDDTKQPNIKMLCTLQNAAEVNVFKLCGSRVKSEVVKYKNILGALFSGAHSLLFIGHSVCCSKLYFALRWVEF
jgi:hypothetical protein